MPWFATEEDRLAAISIEDWIETARDEVDDIGGWRAAPGGRHWPRPPRHFWMRTQYLSGYLTTHHPQLDPAPVHDIYLHVSAWYADWNADRLPPQQVLEELLDRAVLVLNSAMAAIENRIGESITKGISVRVLDAEGRAVGVFFPETAQLVARHFEPGTNAGSANLHQLPDGQFVLHRGKPLDEEVAKTARLLSAGEAAQLLRSWGQPLPAGMAEVDGLANLCVEPAAPRNQHGATPGEGEKPPPDPYADLRWFARAKLKGQELAVIEALCNAGGELPIADLAVKDGVGWDDPFQGFKDAQRRLNSKLKPEGWRLERRNNAASVRPS